MADKDFEPPPQWRIAAVGLAELFQQNDWAAGPLGPRERWSPSLNLAVGMILASAFPMALRWGPDFVLLYNDAYRPILGDKHPWALGRPAREAWAEVWPQIEPAHVAILHAKTPAIFAEDMVLRIQRHGAAWEDAHFTLGYSAIDDPTAPTGVGGVLVTAVEDHQPGCRRSGAARHRGALPRWPWTQRAPSAPGIGTSARIGSSPARNLPSCIPSTPGTPPTACPIAAFIEAHPPG